MIDEKEDDLPALKAALAADIERIVERLAAGRRVTRSARQLRIGNKGSLVIETAGRKRGEWFNHEAETGGGPLQLIQHLASTDFAGAVEWARNFTGIRPDQKAPRKAVRRAVPVIPAQQAPGALETLDDARRARLAANFWKGAIAPDGTIAERYLIETRGIPKPPTGWPQSVKFHPRERALILASTTATGAVQAVQLVRLTAEGQKIQATETGPLVKQSYGPQISTIVRLPGPPGGPLLYAEGPETGLTVWAATGHETHVALGSLAKLTPPAGRRVIICRDDDVEHPVMSPAAKAIRRAIQEWKKAGHNVTAATPWETRRQDKSDFNDVIQAAGPDAVRRRIDAALIPKTAKNTRLSVTAARKYLDSKIASFFDTASNHQGGIPPVHAIKADVGTGKSLAARRHIARMLAELRAAGDDRTIVLAVPTHKLGAEQARAFDNLPEAKKAGLKAAVWRGMEAGNPNMPGSLMCLDIEAIRSAREVMADAQKQVCRSESGGVVKKCQFFDVCGYQRQRRDAADLWIVPHDLLFTKKPSALGTVAALVVDESCWQSSLTGHQGKPLQLALDGLDVTDKIGSGGDSTERLMYLRRSLLFVLRQHIDGPVEREALMVAGFTGDMAAEAVRLEWMRKVVPPIHPGMTAAERNEAKQGAASNRTLGRFVLMWKAVEALLADGGAAASGWLELTHDDSANGPTRVLRLKGRRPISEGFIAPTLLIDATLQPDLIRPIWPQVVVKDEVLVEAPHQRVRQVVDRSYSKGSLKTNGNSLKSLHASLCAFARRYAPNDILIVAQQDIEIAIQELGNLPGNARLAHHNAVAGRDEWRDVACLVVVGRTQAPPDAVTRMAEAMTGSHIPLLGWYAKTDAAREMADGTHEAAEADRHPDTIAEAVRWSICEGQLVQIIGRGRGVNRTEASPLDVFVLTDVPLPLPLAGTISSKEIEPTPQARMLAEAGIAFEGPAAAAAAFSHLWTSDETARKAFQRSQKGTFSYKEYIYENVPLCLHRLSYQLEGPRRSPAIAWFDPQIMPDPVAWITERLGPVKTWTIDNPASAPRQEAAMNNDAETGLLDPAMIYRAPMTEAPPANSWRLGNGNYIEESRGLLLSAPSSQPARGQITCYSAEHKENPVAIEWTETEAYLVPARATRIPFGALVAIWGEDAKTWPPGRKVQPGSLQHLVWPWMTNNGLPSADVRRLA